MVKSASRVYKQQQQQQQICPLSICPTNANNPASLLSSTSKDYLCSAYLIHFFPHHGTAPVDHKHYVLWQLLQVMRGKKVHKVSIHDLKPETEPENEYNIVFILKYFLKSDWELNLNITQFLFTLDIVCDDEIAIYQCTVTVWAFPLLVQSWREEHTGLEKRIRWADISFERNKVCALDKIAVPNTVKFTRRF